MKLGFYSNLLTFVNMRDTINKIREKLSGIYPEQEAQNLLRIIIEYATGQSLPTLLSDKNKQITALQKQNIDEIIDRLLTHEPIQYITGETEFFGSPFVINKNVLIPRPETEELVELILNENKIDNPQILDIGTGSGGVAVSLKKHISKAIVEAWDFSEEALDVAELNAKQNSTEIIFKRVDVLKNYPTDNRFDIIVSNPPYVLESEKQDMDANVLSFEPHSALFVPDSNPLLFYERIAEISKSLFNKKGMLYFEINQKKGNDTVELLREKGYINIKLIKDMTGNDRIVKAEYNIL